CLLRLRTKLSCCYPVHRQGSEAYYAYAAQWHKNGRDQRCKMTTHCKTQCDDVVKKRNSKRHLQYGNSRLRQIQKSIKRTNLFSFQNTIAGGSKNTGIVCHCNTDITLR